MTTQKDLELITFLTTGTENGQIQWQPAAESDQFVSALRGKYGVRVGKAGNLAYMTVKDSDDRELLSVSSDESYGVERLFDAVRRAALKVDQAIDDILNG